MKLLLAMTFIVASVSALARNAEPLTPDEGRVIGKLEALQWRATLSPEETAFVASSLASSKDAIAEAALCTAVVHDLRDLQELLQRGVGPANGYSRLLATIIAGGLEDGRGPLESLRRDHLLERVPRQLRHGIAQKAGRIAAVMAARMARKGAISSVDAHEFTFSSFDQMLLHYSEYPAADAKREIVQRLANATVAGTDEYDLVRVLASYEGADLDLILAAFEDEKTGEYGKLLLIAAVEEEDRLDSLTDAERQRAKAVFGEYHPESKTIERALRQVSAKLERAAAADREWSSLQAFGGGADEGDASVRDTSHLLSKEREERSQALESLSAGYHEVSAALLQTLGEAQAQFRTDRRYHSPLHCAIQAVDAWQVVDADTSLLSMVDYELDIASLPLGMKVAGDYFYPAASALVRLRVDVAKLERALTAAEDPKTLRMVTWVLLEREGDVEKAKRDLADARSKSHGTTEKQNISKALELLDNPSDLLPLPWKVVWQVLTSDSPPEEALPIISRASPRWRETLELRARERPPGTQLSEEDARVAARARAILELADRGRKTDTENSTAAPDGP
jgi:hypothetical protein